MLETIGNSNSNSNDLLNDFLKFDDLEKQGILNDGAEEEGVESLDAQESLEQIEGNNLLEQTNIPPVDEEENEDESTEDSEESEDDGQEYDYKAFVSYLSEEGLVNYELSDEAENSPEILFESVKSTIEKGINDYKESIPEVAKQFLDYLDKGGDPSKYIESFQKPIDFKEIDLTEEDNQERVVREFLKSQDFSQDEIDETIQDYKDSLILEKQAALASKKLDKLYSVKQEQLIAEQEQAALQAQEQYVQYVNTIQSTIDTSQELAGLPVSNKVKSEFKQYLLAKDKDGLTQYQKEYNENPVQTQLELAFLKFMKYDFSTAAKTGKTQAVRNLKEIFKKNEPTVKGKSNSQQKEETANFDAFKAFRSRQQ